MHNRSRQFKYFDFSDDQLKSTILDKNNLNVLANKLMSKLKIDNLRKDQIQDFLSHVNKLNFYELNKNFDGTNKIDKINNKIISLYLNKLNTKQEYTNTHEILKKEIGNKEYGVLPEANYARNIAKKNKEDYDPNDKVVIDTKKGDILNELSELSVEKLIDIARVINRPSIVRDSNIIIDSRYRSLANTNTNEIEFNIIQNIKTKVAGTGDTYAHGETRQIIEMQIYSFSIPYTSNADNYYKKITMSIKEMLPISFEAYEDSQFHFMFNATVSGNLIFLEPINSVFKFYKPVTHIGGSFTLRFGSPFAPVIFNKDRLDTLSINYTTNPLEITFAENHNLITGDLIYIEDFTTLNPAADLDIINDINRKDGHLCSRIDNVTISINIDGTAITSPDNSHISNVYFGSKRIFFPINFKYLSGYKDENIG